MEGNWIFYYDEIQELSLSENPALAELLADMIQDRQEVSQINIRSDCLDICFYLDHCSGCQEEAGEKEGQMLTEPSALNETATMQRESSEERAGTEDRNRGQEQRTKQLGSLQR